MSTSSSIPVLSDVLFYTPNEPYNYQVDNRPLYNLDTNIRHVASSLVGIGYGEHTAISGTLLSSGKVVELLPNGLIRYPNKQTLTASNTNQRPILGLVIGITETSLNRVIWASEHLDLEALGLEKLLSNPASDSLLVTECSDDVAVAGKLSAVITPSPSQLVIGKVKTFPCVSISANYNSVNSLAAAANAAKANHHNLYGFSRVRNLLLVVDAGQTPVQYTKETFYQSDLGSSTINPMSAKLNANLSQIIHDPSVVTYDANFSFRSKVLKERYYQFKTADKATDSVSGSSWPSVAYPKTLTGSNVTYENFELASKSVAAGVNTPDYSNTLDTFKAFTIEKYYQYVKTSYQNTTIYGKLAATATVFNPAGEVNLGGEPGRIIIWDFYEYDSTSGNEKRKHRIVTTGTPANSLFTNEAIFPKLLVNLQ